MSPPRASLAEALSAAPLLRVEGLTRHFGRGANAVHALDGVGFALEAGRTLGVVGESGSGKTTLGRLVVRLDTPTAGRLLFDGTDLTQLRGRALRRLRPALQMVFQDPQASLNARATAGRIIEDPLRVNRIGTAPERRERVAALMARVGLRPEHAGRAPHEFSGGQRQRIGIARALALRPRLVVADEPVSALDVSVRAQVLNLLVDLQQEFGLAYLFISHDLAVVRHVADRIAVLYLGRLVELADRDAFWARPLHPYSQALLAAIPVPDPATGRLALRPPLAGDMPSPRRPPPGCRFHTRCPHAMAVCRAVEPALLESAPGQTVACHLVNPP